MNRAQFTFYRSYYDAIQALPKKDQAAVLLAICAYALDSEEPKLSGTAKAIFTLVRPTLDTGRRKAMGGKNGSPSKDNGKMDERYSKDSAKEKEGEKEKEVEIEYECIPPTPSPEKKKQKVVRHKRGEYGWVKLSDEEYSRLVNDLGQSEVDRCIKYVDESAQGTHNKNEWSDWNLVVRKCHREGWGLKQYGKKQTNPTREEMDAQRKDGADWMKQYMRR